ncbi:MAG: CHAT domain-containing protein [Cyanobacteria bacterium P01_A01_bin.68]
MRSQQWFAKIILFALAFIFTFTPALFPKADARDIYNPTDSISIYVSEPRKPQRQAPRSAKLFFSHIILNNSQSRIKYITQNNLNLQSLLETGQRLYNSGNFTEAISVLKQAALIFQNQGNLIKQAIALSNISLAYKQIGEYQQALSYITQSHNLLEIQPNSSKSKERLKVFAQVLDIQANLQLALGKPLKALYIWKKATAIYKRVNFQNGKNRSLINQNLALQALGRYRQASKILEDLLEGLNKQPASVIKVIALRNLGDAKLYLGEIDTALETLEKSYEIAQKIKSTPQIAETLLSLGNAKRAKGNKARSQLQKTTNFAKNTPLFYISKPISPEVTKLYKQALQSYEKTVATSASPAIKIKAQLNLFSVLIELGDFSKASNLYSQLQLTINQLPVSETSIQAGMNLAQYLLFLKQVSSANTPEWEDIAQILAAAIKGAQILEDVRSQAYGMGILGNVYLQAQNLTDAQQLTKKAVDLALTIEAKDIAYLWQWQLGYIFKIQNKIPEASYYYSQAVNNINDLRGDLLVLNPDIQFSFRDDVEPVYRQLVDLLLQPSISQNISQKNLKQARDAIEALQLREIENYFQEVCLQAKPEIVDTVVEKTDRRAAVIYPIILQNRIEIILKLPNQSQFNRYTTFIQAHEIEQTLDKLQYSLRQPEEVNQVKKISGEVYSWLIKPLEVDLQKNQVETLVFVLDGTLRNIPMAVLYDGRAKENEPKYLIEKYAIALTPGLQMLEPKPLQKKELNALISGISEKRFVDNQEFNSLKHVSFELQTIQSQIPESKKLLNKSFTDINLEKQIDSAKYTVVHIATHGNFSSNLEETYILTWNKLLKVKDFDRLFQINTNTDSEAIQLLVLSACETANGDNRATLGLSGIAVRAGARSTLATLWAVEDKSTAKLMSQFYQELQKNKFNKAKALQQAQINLLKDSKLPLVWAPYVLVGNWL